jgi:hypothetical protein
VSSSDPIRHPADHEVSPEVRRHSLSFLSIAPAGGKSSHFSSAPVEDLNKHRLIRFLREELALPESALAILSRHQETDAKLLPMVLWQYGLVNLEELNRIFDWFESA